MKYKALLMSPLGLIPVGLQTANAADMPVKAPHAVAYTPSWAGFYAGVNLGLISDRSSQDPYFAAPTAPGGLSYCWSDSNCGSKSQTATGLLGGLQIGYNFQSGQMVYGVETDFALSTAKRTVSGPNGAFNAFAGNWSAETGSRWFGTARLRIGYAFDSTLVYATGGVAYADMRNSFKEGDAAFATFPWTAAAGWRAGWTLGGGVEYAVARNWSVKAEGLFYDLGRKDHVATDTSIPGDAYGVTDHMTGVVARIGLNYMFH
jgi:outer membrane immunogenic protein